MALSQSCPRCVRPPELANARGVRERRGSGPGRPGPAGGGAVVGNWGEVLESPLADEARDLPGRSALDGAVPDQSF